jgi:hypothetical protein
LPHSCLGGHVEACEDSGQWRIAYNSCRNRHCPKCQGAAARTGEIVSKDALMRAVWPDTFVTDDSLTQALAISPSLGRRARDRRNPPQARLPAECRFVGGDGLIAEAGTQAISV